MGAAHCCDLVSVTGSRKPIMDRGPDPAAFHRRFAGAVMTGNQQQKPVPTSDSLIDAAVNCCPCSVEVHAVKVEHPIGLD